MKLILCDLNINMIKSWHKFISQDRDIEIINGSIFDVKCDALVSPANSFGFMDGGLDLKISRFFGWHVQEKLQKIIQEKYHGELLVGLAEIIRINNEIIKYVISAPTMRVPMILKNSINVYLATRAVLILIKYGKFKNGEWIKEKVKKVAIPGMGTGVGRMPYETCALQMKKAIDEIFYEKYEFPKTWLEAQERHQLLYRQNIKDLQFEI